MAIFVTGGAGFIGSNFVINWLLESDEILVNIDKLTYAGNLSNLDTLRNNNKHIFVHGDICNDELIIKLLYKYKPRVIINFAAESHVDRSIHGPKDFIQTNIFGTFQLLESARNYWNKLNFNDKNEFRFVHISTDEVYGSLRPNEEPFNELNRYQPNSPYSASKASADLLVRSYFHTYNFPVLTTNCSNNYGPYQFPEKLIPLVINNALNGKNLPIYGDGSQIRDWLYVDDHCAAIKKVIEFGKLGEVYNIGGDNEKTNLEVVVYICKILDKLSPRLDGHLYEDQISFIRDRPGHDQRYAINASKIKNDLRWKSSETFASGMKKTVQWYINNLDWVESTTSKEHLDWIDTNYD
jgi:dTDP-glucose 4,6-dehydratase